jgi:thioesterase domain-containing protein
MSSRKLHCYSVISRKLLSRSAAGAGRSGCLFFLNGCDLGAEAGVRTVCAGVGPILVEECNYDMRCIASRMTDLVRAAQPEGPYLLAGFCFGGFVALEVARRLIEEGQEVDGLFLVETPHLSTIRRLEPIRKSLLVAFRTRYALNVLASRSRIRFGTEKPVALPHDRRLAHYIRLSAKTLNGFTPQPYPGRIVLIFGDRSRYRFFAASGWRETAIGGYQVRIVGGNHTLGELLAHDGIARVVAETVRSNKLQ